MVPAEEALRLVLESAGSCRTVAVPLDSAFGLILAEDVNSDMDIPCIHTASCEGFAVLGDELRYEITIGNSVTDPVSSVLARGRACPVGRGDPMPEGADRVVPACEASVEDTVLYLDRAVRAGANIRFRGDDAGMGQLVLESGTRLSHQHLGIAALAGREVVRVFSRPATGLLSVGDHLVPSTWRTAPGRVRDPLTPMLRGQLSCSGFAPVISILASGEKDRFASALEQALESCEVILTAGGTGHVTSVLEGSGFSFRFRMVAQRPAGSMACAIGPGDEIVFLLPEEPLAAMICVEEYVLPCLRRRSGFKGCRKRVYSGETTFEYTKEPGLLHFLRVLAYREGSDWKLHLPEPAESEDLTGAVSINALAVAGPDQLRIRAGERIPFHFLCSTAGELSFA